MSDDWYTDYAQNKKIRGLQEDLDYVSSSLAAARSSQNRLRAELSKVSGSLEQRLDRLSSAFDAFVEISDLRVTLGLFDAPARVRHQAKQLLAGTPVPDEVSDVDGYWLPPALVALQGVSDGAVDTDALGLAAARDTRRAAVLHVLLVGVLGGRETVSGTTLAEALPEFGAELPRHQRAVWTLAADGFFGEAGWQLARGRCVDVVRDLPAEVRARLRDTAAPKAAGHTQNGLEGAPELVATLLAAEKLTTLRGWVRTALDGYTGEPPAAPDPLVRTALEQLIDEGSPVELPLLQRERELRVVIEGTGTQPSTWDTPVGPPTELLLADVVDEEHPNRRALAVRALAEPLLAIADDFAETARRPAPTRMSVRTRYGQVTITATGAEPQSLRKAEDLAERANQIESQRRVTAIAAGAVALVALVLTFVGGWGWLLVTAGAAAVGGYQWLAHGRDRVRAAQNVVAAKEKLHEEVAARVAAFAEARSRLADQRAVDENLSALRAALA